MTKGYRTAADLKWNELKRVTSLLSLSVVNFFTSIWLVLFVVCFFVYLQLFSFPTIHVFPWQDFLRRVQLQAFRLRLHLRCQVVQFFLKDFHSSINKISFERGPQGERGPEINFDRVLPLYEKLGRN